MAMIATLTTVDVGFAQTEDPLWVQLEQCLEGVMAQDAAPFDAYETRLSMDEERDGLPHVRRMIEPDTGASMVLFAVTPLYFDTATEVGADCRVIVPAEDEAALQILSDFRTELADRFGDFAPYTTNESIWDYVTCVAERPLRIILQEQSAIGGGREHMFSIWNSTREGTSC